MKAISRGALLGLSALALANCTPDWATSNNTPFILEIASITNSNGELPILSDVAVGVQGSIFNDEAEVTVNVFRKNNSTALSTSPVEHLYLERYEVRYFRTDGRNVEGVDVPFRVTGPMGNLRFHTAGPSAEVEIQTTITIVRHQAKLEPPLRNLRGVFLGDTRTALFGGAGILTTVAEITIHGRTVQGGVLQAVGRAQVTFADFADATN
jgi:hypothetical protein